ncbi:sensor histidine kinase [Halorubrum sp. SD626R]|uniref:sensor histidine kinase n=1 Tax=Halorubrum sp. SD626R TaxID=1419722 RepID=UPI000A611B13|nr:sensor histidine kinase [Halorubrum sp. SD626R]TKX81896.1 sensor histidine kinase [Halorubrum sp. SD626R]
MVTVSLLASLAVDAVAVALLAWVTWRVASDRSPPNADAFAALSGGLLLWAVLSLISEFPHAWSVGANLAGLGQFVPAVFVPGIWLVYVLGYAGRGTGLSRPRIAVFVLLALPFVGAVAAFDGDPTAEAVTRSLASVIGTALFQLSVVYVYAAVVFLRYGWNHDRISKGQLAAQLGAVSAPYVVGAWRDGNVVVDGVTGGLLLSGALLFVSLRRYPVLTVFPKADYVARSRVVEALQEAVIVVDWAGDVLDANAAAEELFGRSSRAMIGEPISSVAEGIGVAALSPGATDFATLRTTRGRREFRVTVSGVSDDDPDADPVARAVVLRDVTDRRTREQRLSVLNRVLRHNVRNKLDVILAHADRIEDEGHGAPIRDSAAELASVSRKAREAEAVMTHGSDSPSTIDLAAVAREVVTDARREYPESSISLDAPDDVRFVSHRTIVRRLVAELVENAVVHSDDPARAEVIVDATADGTPLLRVSDDGPGIPDRERDLLTDAGETQREHGLGVGLWFVNWATSQLGAELEFEREDRGTTATVRFHGAHRSGDTPAESGQSETLETRRD